MKSGDTMVSLFAACSKPDLMNSNEQLIHTFYSAFQKRDFKNMQACYADNATFSDEVFVGLNAAEVKAMWEMLCIRGKDLQIEFGKMQATDTTGSAEWKATYSFSKTNRRVINRITAHFIFENGKIKNHTDQFNFYTWAKQAFGLTGLLLGWTSTFREKVRTQAKKNLNEFLKKH